MIDVTRLHLGDVELGGYALRMVEGTWSAKPAQRFGQKISVGPLKYQDFNPYESGFSISTINGGYGLQNYSDLSSPDISTLFYDEGTNIDASEIYPVLSPPLTPEYLPFPETSAAQIVTGTPVFMGEWTVGGTTYYTAVAGNFVFTRNSDGSWTRRIQFITGGNLAKIPVKGAVAIFNNTLIVGFGAEYTAVYCTGFAVAGDVVDGTATPIFVFALTADRAAVYAAANTAATVGNQVISSADGITFSGTPVVCGDPGVFLNAMAPGGGICQVFVGKPTEMGWINNDGVYQKLMDYDTSNASNSLGMRLYLGNPHDEQNGATVVCVPRDHDLYQFAPSSQTSGQATNASPWAQSIPDGAIPKTVINPTNQKGIFTALQGTARFLYAVVQNQSTGNNYLIRRDSRSGGWHTFLDLGQYNCQVMGVTSIFNPEPMLIVGYNLDTGFAGNQIAVASIPLNGLTFSETGTLNYSRIDYLFPNENKLYVAVDVSAYLRTADASIDVYYAIEDGAYSLLGTVSGVGVLNTSFEFPSDTTGRWVAIKLVLNTIDQSVTPQVRAVLIRGTVVPKMYRVMEFSATTPEGSTAMTTDNKDNSKLNIEAFWDMVADASPQDFLDRWGDNWVVRVLDFQEVETYREQQRTPETQMHFVLLTVKRGGGDELWDAELALWDADWALWGDDT